MSGVRVRQASQFVDQIVLTYSARRKGKFGAKRLDEGQKIYRAVGDCAPAFSRIGTLIGMVQMFANMTDPSKLEPFMAVALLATFYGAAVANLLCLPIADKLHLKLVDEKITRTLIIDRILDPGRKGPDAGARDAACPPCLRSIVTVPPKPGYSPWEL